MRFAPLTRVLCGVVLLSVMAASALSASAASAGDGSEGRPTAAQAESRQVQVDHTKSRSAPVTDRIIVKYRQRTSGAARRELRAAASGTLVRTLRGTGAEVLRLPRGADPRVAARLLARDPAVLYATPDVVRRANTVDPGFPQQWGLSNTGQTVEGRAGVSTIDTRATAAWTTTVGNPSTLIAVTDTGIDIDHPDLTGAIWTNPGESGALATNGLDDDNNGYVDDVHGWDFANDDASVFDLSDGDEHGTHVAGTIAATADNSIGGAGVAYGVKILPLKFLGRNGGYDSDAIEAIAYAKAQGAKVINASWGSNQSDGYADSAALKDAIASCGCTFVAAAGNDGGNNDIRNGANYPASFDLPNIVSVAAIDNSGALAGFSAYGATSVDVAAPGVSILSTVPRPRAGIAAVHVSPGVYTAQHWGFGLEDIVTAAKRADLLDRALGALGTADADPVLLVADDEADTIPGQSSFYTTALSTLGFTNVTTVSVATDTDGPSAATMAGKTVIWQTGLSYGDNGSFGPLRTNDRSALTTFLDGGGKLLLAGADAIYLSEESTFVRDRLKITFLREEGTQTVLSGLAAPYVAQSYTASSAESWWGQTFGKSNPYRDIVEVRSAGATAVLQYPGEANYDNAYDYYNGTSMAAPHVSGVAALLLSRWPSLDGAALADRITVSARPAAGLAGKVASGGFVDAALAVGNEPSPPPSVGARVVNGNLYVSWSASVGPFGPVASSGGYQVQLVRDGTPVGGWTAFDAPGEYAMRDVPGGGTYAARVRAVGTTGETLPRQSAASAVMASGGVPNQVTGVTVTYTDGAPLISWAVPPTNGSGVLTYEICVSGGPCRTLTGSIAGAPAPSLTWDTPPADLLVRAVNSYGTGAFSAAAFVGAYLLPGTPANVTATADDESAVVGWQFTAAGRPLATEAVVTVEPGGREIVVAGTSTRVTGLSNGTAYTFGIRSRNAAGMSAQAVSSSVVPRDVTAPAPVTGLVLTGALFSASLSWANPTDGDLAGVVARAAEGTVAPGPAEGVHVPVAGTTAALSGLGSGATYTVAVYAYDEAGNHSLAATAVLEGSRLAGTVSTRRVTYGSGVTHRTLLTRAATSTVMPGQIVELRHRRTGTTRWTRACVATTASTGRAVCVTKPTVNTVYQWRFLGTGAAAGAQSPSYAVGVRPKVIVRVSDTTVTRGATVRMSGSVAPRHARHRVYLQRYYGGAWRTISSTTLRSTSTYTFAFRAPSRGVLAYRIYKRADANHVATASATRRISVR